MLKNKKTKRKNRRALKTKSQEGRDYEGNQKLQKGIKRRKTVYRAFDVQVLYQYPTDCQIF